MLQLFKVTEYLHSNRICHRDLKPDNVLVCEKMDSPYNKGVDSFAVQIKVIDFNVAVKLSSEDDLIMGSTGLKEWSAPETRQQLYSDCKIDCWSLGCLMFMLCTGKQPFGPHDKIEVSPEFNLLQKLNAYSESGTFSDMVDLIGKLLISDPEKRLSSKEALQHPWMRLST